MTWDKPREECGVYGVYGHPEASKIAYLGLYALQHRGQEGAGLVVSDGERQRTVKGMGLVTKVFDVEKLACLSGHIAIGHVRYSTTGSNDLKNVQPLLGRSKFGETAVAHNGDIINAGLLEQQLEEKGTVFNSTTDSEVILHLVAQSGKSSLVDAVADALGHVEGAYSMVISSRDTLIAFRDPRGFRPLCLGKLDGAYLVSSESCGFDVVGAKTIREVEPGEMLIFSEKGMESRFPLPKAKPAMCIFELIYFARPDSFMFGEFVNDFRTRLGRELARESMVEADVVMPVPDSATATSVGFSRESGIPFEMGIIRNHYVGRTFIEPDQSIRDFGVRVKYNPVRGAIEGKRIIVVDDSIVRGTSSRKIVRMLRTAGAKEIHFRVSSPPIRHVCYYGIDIATKSSLQAHKRSLEQIREVIEADSLHYISHEGLMRTALNDGQTYCAACFDGRYPIEPKKPVIYHLDPRRREPATPLSGVSQG